jgi:nitroimidazol reductase NimA-like FMN-containing flavoprotein (pyridoxamine 5'-phosphate oxidase superfamily)
VERLETSECWTLLQEARLGRLAVIHADGAPDVFPVNFTTYEGSLFVRTARDAKLLHIAQHPLVAFEVDGETTDSHWSVVVRGTAARVTSDDELRRSGVRELKSWSPTQKLFAIKITANTVTGRRFPKHSGRTDRLIAFEGRVRADAPPEPPHPSRGEPPQPIPHHGPRPATAAHPVVPGDGDGV